MRADKKKSRTRDVATPATPRTPKKTRAAVSPKKRAVSPQPEQERRSESAGRQVPSSLGRGRTGSGTPFAPGGKASTGEYEKLLTEREHTLAELKRLRSYLEDEVERVIDGSEDSVDAASDVYEREKTLAIIQTLEKKLASVEHALQAAKKGGYGICEICGNPIDPARLAAMPHSTTCIGCQEKLERQQRRRPFAAFVLRDEE